MGALENPNSRIFKLSDFVSLSGAQGPREPSLRVLTHDCVLWFAV